MEAIGKAEVAKFQWREDIDTSTRLALEPDRG